VAVVFLTGASYLLTPAASDLALETIDKPFNVERLRATVGRHCPLEQSSHQARLGESELSRSADRSS
jgi:DNA-binding LytR/AlgR family response regulator